MLLFMKKKYSLKRNEEIAKIVHRQKFIKDNIFVIYYVKNEKMDHARICISVSKKNGNAVIRNKIKRQIREMVTSIFDFNQNIDYVIIVRNDFLKNSFSVNQEKLNQLYVKIISNYKE